MRLPLILSLCLLTFPAMADKAENLNEQALRLSLSYPEVYHDYLERERGGEWQPSLLLKNEGVERLLEKWQAARIIDGINNRVKPFDSLNGKSSKIYVGPNFYHLGFLDQSKVLRMVTSLYNLDGEKSGTVYIIDSISKRPIGHLNATGYFPYRG